MGFIVLRSKFSRSQNRFTLEERKIDYVLVGGIAILHYVEGRNTQDLDLLMATSSLQKLLELNITSQDMYFTRANYGELQIDIFLTQNPLFKKVHQPMFFPDERIEKVGGRV